MFLLKIFKGKAFNTKLKGKAAEDLASKYLLSKGYKILERNFRKQYGEIDIIARKDNVLIFVEVRSLKGDFMEPCETISYRKKEKIIKTATAYLQKIGWGGEVRFDFVGIKGDDSKIEHIENFFGF